VKIKRKFLSIVLTILFMMSLGGTGYAKVKPAYNLPVPPVGLAATSISTSEIELSWTSVANASGYKIYMATPNDANYTQIATLSGTSYKNTGLTTSTKYWYYVAAYNSYGTSSGSTHISKSTLNPIIINTSKFLLGFATYYYSGDSSSYNSMVNNKTSINEIATDTYTTDGLGNISGLVPASQVSYANSNGIKPVAMITNNFSGSIAQTLLENTTNRQALINNTLNAIKANNFKGVNVDIEGIYSTDRSYFTTFMKELYTALHPLGYEVSVCVPAKTVDSSAYTWNYAYDYAQLSNYCDRVVIMSYDEHYPGGQPGPVASISWVQNVAAYTATVIPTNKIVLGLAAYGYDWSSTGTKAYGIDAIIKLALTHNATIQWDSVSQCPYFNYVDAASITHNVWFENSTSIAYKLDIINKMNLSGAAIWRLGLENTDYWTTVKTKLGK